LRVAVQSKSVLRSPNVSQTSGAVAAAKRAVDKALPGETAGEGNHSA